MEELPATTQSLYENNTLSIADTFNALGLLPLDEIIIPFFKYTMELSAAYKSLAGRHKRRLGCVRRIGCLQCCLCYAEFEIIKPPNRTICVKGKCVKFDNPCFWCNLKIGSCLGRCCDFY